MYNDKKQYLLSLIEKLQSGRASKEEVAYLANFFSTDQESEDWPLEKEIKNEIKENIFNKIKNKTISAKRKGNLIHFDFKKVLKYAAVFVALIATGYYFAVNTRLFNSYRDQQVLVKNNIEIGTDKAILTLENGQEIALVSGENFISNSLKSDGQKLIYEKSENSKEVDSKVVYNILTVPRGGKFYIELSDGTKAWLNSDSKLKYPVSFVEGKPREVDLLYGEAFFEVSSSELHQGSKFTVSTSMQKIEVLGTKFNVKAYQDEEIIYTTLIEGKVALQVDNYYEILDPSQQFILNRINKNRVISEVDVYPETAWIKGLFVFKKKSLKDIMIILSRWYDVSIVFEDENLKNIEFKGVLSKNQQIEDILSLIKSTNFIKGYEIKEHQIIIK
jgi:hypothetical protein